MMTEQEAKALGAELHSSRYWRVIYMDADPHGNWGLLLRHVDDPRENDRIDVIDITTITPDLPQALAEIGRVMREDCQRYGWPPDSPL